LIKIINCIFLILVLASIANGQISIINDKPITATEQLSFKSCVEGTNVIHTVFCYDTNQLVAVPTMSWDNNCRVSTINLEEFKCTDIELQSTYNQNTTLKKSTLRIYPEKTLSNPRGILDSQSWDGGWSTASDTAYAIWILSEYGEEYSRQINEGLEWLKKNRLEAEKCWTLTPNRCSIYETSRTLLFLKFSGINITEKVYQDAIMWLDSRMNYIENSAWEIRITPLSDGNCVFRYGDAQLFSGEVERNKDVVVPFTAEYEKLINVSCEDMGNRIYIYDSEKRNIFYQYFEKNNDKYFDYTIIDDSDFHVGSSSLYRIPPPCWGASDKWQYCNRKTTLYALLLEEFSEEKMKLGRDWLEGELRSGLFVGQYLSTEESILDSALMLYKFDFSQPGNKQSIREWLVHTQNNDGSWGRDSEDIVVPTGFSILALQEQSFPGKEQVIQYGINWLSRSYPKSGWDTFEKEAISYIILSSTAKPFLKIDEIPLRLTNKITTTVNNPTGFDIKNITYEITGSIENKIKITELKEITKFDSKKLEVSPIFGKAGEYSGIINLISGNISLLKIPIYFKEEINLDIEVESKEVHTFSNNGNIEFRANTNANFNCDIVWQGEEITTSKDIEIRNSGLFSIPFTAPKQNSKYSGEFICNHDKRRYEIPFSVEVIYHDYPPIHVSRSRIRINKEGRNETVVVKNNLDIPIKVEVEFDVEPFSLTLGSRNIELEPKESKEIKIINLALQIEGEYVEENTNLVFKSMGEEQTVTVSLRLLPLGQKRFSIIKILFYFILLAGLGFGVWTYYKYKKVNKEEGPDNNKNMDEIKKDIKKKITNFRKDLREVLPEKYKKYIPKTKQELEDEKNKIREEIEKNHLKDMVVVMKKLNKSDKEIAEKLLQEGLLKAEIDEVIKIVNIEEKIKSNMDQEKEAMKIVKLLDGTPDIRELLQKKGFSKETIGKVFEEIEGSITEKEKSLKEEREKR